MLSFPQGLGSFRAGQRPFINGLGHLEQPAGAVPSGVKAGQGGLHVFVHEDAVPVHLGPQLAGQRGAARNAQRHENAGKRYGLATAQFYAADPLFAEDDTVSYKQECSI